MSADAARLRWRCRRGMRELDQLLGGWLDSRYPYAELLEQPDPQLWDWLSGREAPACGDWQRIVDEIRNRGRI